MLTLLAQTAQFIAAHAILRVVDRTSVLPRGSTPYEAALGCEAWEVRDGGTQLALRRGDPRAPPGSQRLPPPRPSTQTARLLNCWSGEAG